MIEKHLKSISINAIELNKETYSEKEKQEQWIGKAPATVEEIIIAEKRLGISLPKDVIAFYKISNGTSEILSHTFSEFMNINQIDWLKNLQPETIEAYAGMGPSYEADLNNSILIAGLNHVHQILIIQPYAQNKAWKYWEFASYIPGESAFNGIENYLDRIDNFLKEQIKNKTETIPTIYYGDLKEALVKQDWLHVYGISTGIILENLQYTLYCPDVNLFGVCLLATHYLGNQNHFITFLNALPQFIKNDRQVNTYLIEKYRTCAENKEQFFYDLQELNKIKPQENPKTIADIEEQINVNRKDLLKPEESISKNNYILHFLFEYGNTQEFISIYESLKYEDSYFDLLKTARVYLFAHQNDKALQYVNKYIAENDDQKIMEIYLDAELIKLLVK